MLFDEYTLRGLRLKNRLVRSATYEKRADIDGFVTDAVVKFYTTLADGGVGLIITGNVLVHVSGRSAPQMLCIHNDFYTQKLRRLTDAIHSHDGTVVIQLVHGGRQCFPAHLGGLQPIGPSAVYDPSTRVTPREMTHEEIWEIIEAFRSAARRAMHAGFDGIQIHGAHGYLVNEFLSPHTNRRDDYWGGDEERRFHFVEELCKAMRDEMDYQHPLMIKMNAEDYVGRGLTVGESARIAKRLQAVGIDAIEVSGGMYESGIKTAQTDILKPEQEAYFRQAAREIRGGITIPVILVGGIRSRTVAEDILAQGDADLVALSRPLIREPDLPEKFREGKETADCISCNGCLRFTKLDVVKCTQILERDAQPIGARKATTLYRAR